MIEMDKQHLYSLTIDWTGNNGSGTSDYKAYERSHTVSIPNKTVINCSSDPSFRGDPNKHNPEELFVSSIASCHMLWYLHLCSEAGITITSYTDNAQGIMGENTDGSGHFKEVTLNPLVFVKEASMVEKAIELHKKANQLCFIANSCNFPIHHKPQCKVSI